MKLVLFSDLEGRPVYVTTERVLYLTKLAEDKTIITFGRDHSIQVEGDIETVAEKLDPESGPTE